MIYNEVLRDEPTCVKEDLTFVRAQRAMGRARIKTRPPTPESLEKLVEKFDAGVYPEKYQALYRGSVTVTIRGEMVFASFVSGRSSLNTHLTSGSPSIVILECYRRCRSFVLVLTVAVISSSVNMLDHNITL